MLANDIDKQDPSTSTDPPPIVRCKTCNVPLPDALWKNCERCRRNRTESHNRWKKSVQERTIAKLAASNSQPYLPPSETGIPSTSLSNVKPPPTTFIAGQRSQQPPHSGAFTPSQAPQAGTYTTLPYHQPNNEPPTPSSQPTGSIPRTAPAAAPPRPVHVPEYQWGDKLVDDLTELPPRSNFVGKFSTILDPQVNNSSRLHIFANQLRAKGLPISETSHSAVHRPLNDTHTHTFACTCQESCRGWLVISVDDDHSHPYRVPGQRISVGLVHLSH